MTKDETIAKAKCLFDEGYACSQSVLLAFADEFELNHNTAKLISSSFGGGMGRLRQKCGAVTGGFMVLGLAYGNANPNDLNIKLIAYKEVWELNQKVEDLYSTTNCFEILQKHAAKAEVTERKYHK